MAERFAKEQMWTKYAVSGRVNPFLQRADLDGDGRADYAVLIQDLSTEEESIALLLTSQTNILFSARKGRPFDGWVVLPKGTKLETGHKLKYESIVIKFGGPGFVMTWNGRDFDSLPWAE